MKRMHLVLATAIALLSANGLAMAQEKGGVIDVATVGEPPTLDPMASTADLVGIITQNIFETLYTFDANWNTTPLLAAALPDISSDGTTYTIPLRQGIKFHDGSTMTADDTTALMQTLVALRKTGPSVGGRAPAPSPVVMRGLALAALAVLGRAGEEDVGKLAPLLTDAKSEDCMKMAKLNLYQCLAVAGPHYEHAFCLGQHALMDTGQCVIQGAGASQPLTVAANPPLVPSATPATAASDAAQPDLIDSLISTQR